MKISLVWYGLKQGLKNIVRNPLFSLASIGTVVACLFLFGVFYAVILNLRGTMNNIQDSISISVFFEDNLTDEEIEDIGKEIKSNEEVKSVEFVSAEDAWKEFTEKTYDDPEAARAVFGDDNPLEDSASYTVTLKDVSNQTKFVEYLEGIDGVRKVVSSAYAAESMSAINVFVGYASFGIIIILILVSVFLISNTITVGITIRSDEIKLMRIIGARNAFVKAPFIMEGLLIGLVGSILPLIILFYLYDMIVSFVTERFYMLSNLLRFVSAWDLFKTLTPITILLGIGIGLIGSA
ncbi:MAG: permease-like cell division protein FtsX, partial [Lachnospiraceae bacterium]|nr:permease-like cell division protein FtsX [Lachnospiraceae bacterium]